MDLTLWFAFIGVSAALIAIPGPTALFLIATGLRHGRRGALAAAPAVALGDIVAMSASLAGIGALLAASAAAFAVVKVAGALWLAFLGVKMWRESGRPAGGFEPAGEGPEVFSPAERARVRRHAFLITVLNPKSLMFFVAFAPQFIRAGQPFAPQALTMISSFAALAFAGALVWGFGAGAARARLARPSARRALGRAGGGCLMLASAAAALTARA